MSKRRSRFGNREGKGGRRSSSPSRPLRPPRDPAKDGATNPQLLPATSRLVSIEKPIYGGAFLAHLEGKAVFVPLALPGEEAQVRLAEEKRHYATAEVEEIVSAAPERVAARCRHFGACGSCHYQHAGYASQLEFKRAILRETLERGGVGAPGDVAVLAGDPWGYRNRIRLAFDAEGRPGYRGRRSHGVIPIGECPIAAPLLVRAALAAAETVRSLPSRQRPIEIALFCDAEETALLASVMAGGGAKGWFEDFAGSLAAKIPETKGVERLAAGAKGQAPRRVAQRGATSLLYRAAGFAYHVDFGAFFQVNRWLLDALVDAVVKRGTGRKLAWDLFAGVGLFARQLADQFDQVAAVEAAEAATESLQHNLTGTRARAVRATTLGFLRGMGSVERPDFIVVDPPRAGLGAETTALLGQIAAPELAYVSCDPATLARDLRALLAAGYTIENITLADLFPQTFHIESVVRLRR